MVVQHHQQERGGQHVDAALQVLGLVLRHLAHLAQHAAALGHALGVAQLVEDVVVVDYGLQDGHGRVELALGQQRLGVAENHVDVEVGKVRRLVVDQLVRIQQRHGVVAPAVRCGFGEFHLRVRLARQLEQQPAVVLDGVPRTFEHIVLADGLDCGVLVLPPQLERDMLSGVGILVHKVQRADTHQEPANVGAGGDVGDGAPASDGAHVFGVEGKAAGRLDPRRCPREDPGECAASEHGASTMEIEADDIQKSWRYSKVLKVLKNPAVLKSPDPIHKSGPCFLNPR